MHSATNDAEVIVMILFGNFPAATLLMLWKAGFMYSD